MWETKKKLIKLCLYVHKIRLTKFQISVFIFSCCPAFHACLKKKINYLLAVVGILWYCNALESPHMAWAQFAPHRCFSCCHFHSSPEWSWRVWNRTWYRGPKSILGWFSHGASEKSLLCTLKERAFLWPHGRAV